MTWAEAVRAATERLRAAGVTDPARDARVLARWVAGLEAAGFVAAMDRPADLNAFEAAVAARAARQPVSQITGSRLFWGRSFRVTPDVLDPRPETEILVAAALETPARRVLDLGTGSGCLLLTLLANWPEAGGLGTDLSAAALAVAQANAADLGLADRVAFQEADWLDGVTGAFDLIVSNPPYLTADELAAAPPELAHEPAGALSPGGDGLDAYRKIAAGAPSHLAPNGRLMVEIGASQGPKVCEIFENAGLSDITILPDLDGRDRVVTARDC
ncbi:MAG: peptide chain release factor N(5)-glutamine methyltransferase [Pseudomonadota bacterium]